MPNFWTLGGLTVSDLLRRTARESWEDAVFGQGGRMAFYHFLAIFPSLLVFLAISARVPYLGGHMKDALQGLSHQILPDRVSQLLQEMMNEIDKRALSGIHLFLASAGALWASFNGTWAMIYGLNRAYEVKETRSWRELAVTVAGLTFCLAGTACFAVFLIFCSAHFQARFHLAESLRRIFEWLVLTVCLSISFATLYRFAPNLREHEWRWSTPGAVCALILWIGSTFAARAYFDYVDNYSISYGHLNGVVMLLLWLYVTNGALLIGGEMNSEIGKVVGKGAVEASRTVRHDEQPANIGQ